MTTFSPSHLSFSTVSARLESKQRRASIASSSSSSASCSSTSPWPERGGGGEPAGSRMPWKMREIEKLFRDDKGRAGMEKEKGGNGMEKEKVERVLSEYIRDKRSSARTTKHIDRKLTMLERNVADLGLHACFDAARKRDGKLGNGPLLEPLELVQEGEGGGGLPVYSEKGNV